MGTIISSTDKQHALLQAELLSEIVSCGWGATVGTTYGSQWWVIERIRPELYEISNVVKYLIPPQTVKFSGRVLSAAVEQAIEHLNTQDRDVFTEAVYDILSQIRRIGGDK